MTLDLVIIGIGLVCAAELGWVMARSERLAKAIEMQLNVFGQSQIMSFEVLTLELRKLETRMKALENEVL